MATSNSQRILSLWLLLLAATSPALADSCFIDNEGFEHCSSPWLRIGIGIAIFVLVVLFVGFLGWRRRRTIMRQNQLYVNQAQNDPSYGVQPPQYGYSQQQYGYQGGYPNNGYGSGYAPPPGPPPVNRDPEAGVKYPPPAYGPGNK